MQIHNFIPITMSLIAAGKPFNYKGTTITPLKPVLEDKGEDILEVQKRDNHVIITFPEATQRRFETDVFSHLPIKPTLSPFRFRGRLCLFYDDAIFLNEDKEAIHHLENGIYRGRIHLRMPSINEKDGETYLKMKLVSLILCK